MLEERGVDSWLALSAAAGTVLKSLREQRDEQTTQAISKSAPAK